MLAQRRLNPEPTSHTSVSRLNQHLDRVRWDEAAFWLIPLEIPRRCLTAPGWPDPNKLCPDPHNPVACLRPRLQIWPWCTLPFCRFVPHNFSGDYRRADAGLYITYDGCAGRRGNGAGTSQGLPAEKEKLTKCWYNVGPASRRWPNVVSTFGERFVFAGSSGTAL